MVVAGLAVGFIAGRASVWFAPFDSGRESVAATDGASQAAPALRTIRSGSRELSPPPASAMAAPDKAIENRASPDNVPPSTTPPPSVPADAGAAPPAKRFTLINPGMADTGPDAQSAPAADMRPDQTAADVEECERRYSSFRRSDGTYQPFDGGPRRRCPHLR